MADIFGTDKGTAMPGGNVAKPLIIALLALLASRYFGGKKEEAAPDAPSCLSLRRSPPDPSPAVSSTGSAVPSSSSSRRDWAIRSILGRHRQEQERRSRPVSVALGATSMNCPNAPGSRAIKS
jgi:hypothetical protein